VAFMLIFLEGNGICQAEPSERALSALRRGGVMDEFWKEIIYVSPEAEHACEDFRCCFN
jgi:hypothetical protein